jgi:hypothetical protein
MAKITDIMEQFAADCDAFIASAVFDPSTGQGIIDKSVVESFDPAVPNAYMSEVIKENEKALAALKANARTIDYLITTNQMYIIMRAIEGTKFYQGCAIQKTGNLGMTREIMKKYETRFAAELKKM